MNKENKIKSIYNDYINFIQGNVNKICTLEQNFKLISLIEKLSNLIHLHLTQNFNLNNFNVFRYLYIIFCYQNIN